MESTICLRKKSLYLNDTCDKAKLKWDRWSDDDESKNEQKCKDDLDVVMMWVGNINYEILLVSIIMLKS